MKKLLCVAAVCVGLATFAASGEEQKGEVCQAQVVQAAVDQWKELPKDYASFAALPEEYRIAVFRRLSDADRSALWQAHWQAAVESGRFSADQRELLEEASRFWTADTFAALRSPDGLHYSAMKSLAEELKTRLQASFDDNEMGSLFAQLGAVRTVFVVDPNAVLPSPAPRGGRPPLTPCNCNKAEGGCPFGGDCAPFFNCQTFETGCGYMWLAPCDGVCLV